MEQVYSGDVKKKKKLSCTNKRDYKSLVSGHFNFSLDPLKSSTERLLEISWFKADQSKQTASHENSKALSIDIVFFAKFNNSNIQGVSKSLIEISMQPEIFY